MGQLTYTAIASLDGYVADAEGNFDWAEPDGAVHAFVNELERPVGTYLYGRRMYEVMRFWAAPEASEGQPTHIEEYARIWRDADKVVYSSSLESVNTERTTLERRFDPDAVRALKASAERELSVGGPTLAAAALRDALVDEIRLILYPVLVGGGTRALPPGVRIDLELRDEHRFPGGQAYLRYGVRPS